MTQITSIQVAPTGFDEISVRNNISTTAVQDDNLIAAQTTTSLAAAQAEDDIRFSPNPEAELSIEEQFLHDNPFGPVGELSNGASNDGRYFSGLIHNGFFINDRFVPGFRNLPNELPETPFQEEAREVQPQASSQAIEEARLQIEEQLAQQEEQRAQIEQAVDSTTNPRNSVFVLADRAGIDTPAALEEQRRRPGEFLDGRS
ncbi:hypothetical protein Pan216_33620 [Planctomycetes bacterium Pan216]|uniref:Uncharacterized protein n=1 Tax=Kolteria novifilia TaxID=2527975 RepID=A0A518B692_9BACT|nr:hypothetical protein Pan216_33620 [Planctomycetes bacterium Pan216]